MLPGNVKELAPNSRLGRFERRFGFSEALLNSAGKMASREIAGGRTRFEYTTKAAFYRKFHTDSAAERIDFNRPENVRVS